MLFSPLLAAVLACPLKATATSQNSVQKLEAKGSRGGPLQRLPQLPYHALPGKPNTAKTVPLPAPLCPPLEELGGAQADRPGQPVILLCITS